VVAVAQLVERWTVNPVVASSILVGHPKSSLQTVSRNDPVAVATDCIQNEKAIPLEPFCLHGVHSRYAHVGVKLSVANRHSISPQSRFDTKQNRSSQAHSRLTND
jgi:hypothetical protein